MKTSSHYSLLQRFALSLIAAYLGLLLLLVFNSIYSIQTLRQRVHDQLHDALTQHNTQVTNDLQEASWYMLSYSFNSPDLSTLGVGQKDNNYYSAMYRVKVELTSASASMSKVQGLFVFLPQSQDFVYSEGSPDTAICLREWCRSQTNALSEYVSTSWFPLELDGHYYLVRLMKSANMYIGAWTDFTSIFSGLAETHASIKTTPLFAFKDGSEFDGASLPAQFDIDIQHSENGTNFISKDRIFQVIGCPTSYVKEGFLLLLVENTQIISQLRNNILFILMIGLVFIATFILAFIFLFRSLRSPLEDLKNSLTALRSGDFSIRVPENHACTEFSDVNHAFNQMIERIETLKIHVYEERLLQQEMEMLALKNQIAPHFLINCLNSIYHMTATDDNERIRKMTVLLGDHLRYTLADTHFVALKEEIEKAVNYVELSKLRFPGSITLFNDIPHSLHDVAVPPLVLMFQVENIIKYQVIHGELTEIHLESELSGPEQSLITLRIWDTGSGYKETIISQLNNGDMLNQADGHNIGTKNIHQRLRLMFGNQVQMRFCNRPDAGAQVEIEFPCQKLEEREVLQ